MSPIESGRQPIEPMQGRIRSRTLIVVQLAAIDRSHPGNPGQTHIPNNGNGDINRVYETPFTPIDRNDIDGEITDEGQIIELLDIIHRFDPRSTDKTVPLGKFGCQSINQKKLLI